MRFSETFYDGTWFDGIDQADLLRCITCPAVYLKAKTNYGEDGTLLAANSDEDAARMQQLVAVCETVVVESGHDIHYERPKAFAAVDQMASKYSCPSFSAASYSSRACAMSSVTRPSMP